MKRYITYIGCFLAFLSATSCDDFLDRDPLDKLTNDTYWVGETSLRTYAQEFYSTFFIGYAQDYRAFGGYYSGDLYNDDFLLTSDNSTDTGQRFFFPNSNITGVNAAATTGTTASITNTGAGGITSFWSDYNNMIRKANVMLENIPGMSLSDEAKQHWMGVARFFRAMAYSGLVKAYGDVPYIDFVIDPADTDNLFKDRDSQLMVVGKILEDYNYALANVRISDGTLQVHKYLVGGMMSRQMLYHATWLKYHGTTVGTTSQAVPNTELSKFFQGAIDGAKTVMESNNYAIGNTYNALFSSESLAANKEVIFYREYTTGISCNALMSYNAKEPQQYGGPTVDAFDNYICIDGLPIGQSPNYKGATDPSIEKSFIDRDPRMYETFVDSLRILSSGPYSAAGSSTGFAVKKFLNEDWLKAASSFTTNNLSPADAPVIRYAEALLNYVEARYEISKLGGSAFAQDDIDKSINEIRKRKLTKWGESPVVQRSLPAITLSGTNIAVNGTVINDPARDTSVDPILWEIRRERRTELMMEGRRGDDLNRWAKFDYLNSTTGGNPNNTILGAWIDKAEYPGITEGIKLYNPNEESTTKGYINYFSTTPNLRTFTKGDLNSERNYLRAVPLAQITLYKDKGYTLSQNPGW